MRIEAFTAAREPTRPESNEDAFLVLPGCAYAVIDGVSDRIGTRYDGMLAGRYAATLVARSLEAMLGGGAAPPAPEAIVPALGAVIQDVYRRHAVLEDAQADWGARLCCTLALALFDDDRLHLILVGDSGVRVNGGDILRLEKDLDRITATLRARAWHRLAGRVADPAERERLARRVAWHGHAQDPGGLAPALDAADLAAIAAEAEAACVAALPHVPRADILYLLRHGIVQGQGAYQNSAETVLGYSCLDGFDIPRTLMRIASLDARDVHSLEFFTDGYFSPGAEFGIGAWEAAMRAVEAEDPAKVGRYLSTKGSVPGRWADDRTYVGVMLR